MVESGLPDFVIAWLSTLAQQGMEFTDVRPTSLLFALADRRIAKAMITVWAEGHRWRVIVVSGAVVLHVDQFASELAAVQGVKDRLAQLKDANVDVELCVTGHDDLCSVWPSHFPDTPCERRTDTVQQLAPLGENEKTYLPNAIKNLPLAALLQPNNTRQARVRVEGGASIRALLHLSKWRRRSHQTVAATVTAAVFSGYFVLLSGLHALRIVDLHGRADSELVDLSSRQKTLQEEASQLHTTPIEAAKSIERLPSTGVVSQSHNPAFLAKLAALLNDQPEILIRSLSWRPDDTAHWQQGNLSDITQLPNLLDNHINGSHTVDSEYRIVVIAGLINDATSQQFASDTLINFLDALAGTPSVVDVLPIVHSFASSTTTNLPSDLIYSSPKDLNDPRRFVVAVRVLSV